MKHLWSNNCQITDLSRWCWGHSRLPAQPPDKRLPRFAKTFKSYYTHTHIILKTERNYIYSLPSSILIPDHAPSQILFQNYLSKVVIIVTQVVVLTQKCSWWVDIKQTTCWQCGDVTNCMRQDNAKDVVLHVTCVTYGIFVFAHVTFQYQILYLHMWHGNIGFYIYTCDMAI